jgi:hypothetical protein
VTTPLHVGAQKLLEVSQAQGLGFARSQSRGSGRLCEDLGECGAVVLQNLNSSAHTQAHAQQLVPGEESMGQEGEVPRALSNSRDVCAVGPGALPTPP